MILGLTGGMGCGKSTAGIILARLGARVVDADGLVRSLYAGDAEVRAALRSRHGETVFDAEGAVDRVALASRVFSDKAELAWLEELVHPRVRRAWQAFAAEEPERWTAVEIPLLFEKGLEKFCTKTVCIGARPEVQGRRLAARGLREPELGARLARQWPLEEKQRRADFVVSNNGSLDLLEGQLRRLWALLPPAVIPSVA